MEEEPLPAKPLSALDKLSLSGVATVAAGTLLADGAKALFSNQPTMADVVNLLKSFDQKLEFSVDSIKSEIKALQDHALAVEHLASRVFLIRKRRGKNRN